MENTREKYETLFIINPNSSEEDTAALVGKFKAIIESQGTVESVDEWGKRRLAYEIDDMNEGYYVLINFESDKDLPAELDRVFHITEGIMRSLIVRKQS